MPMQKHDVRADDPMTMRKPETRTLAGKIRWVRANRCAGPAEAASPKIVATWVLMTFYSHLMEREGAFQAMVAVDLPNAREVAATMRNLDRPKPAPVDPPAPYYHRD